MLVCKTQPVMLISLAKEVMVSSKITPNLTPLETVD